MAGKVAERRKALRENLIGIASRRIAADGLSALRARDLATDAGCAVGAIYTIFDDLDDLVLAVNAQTFAQLGADVAASLADAPADATEQLITMAQAYHGFAAAHYQSWRALFDLERPKGETAPDWYLHEMGQLFVYIITPLRSLHPDKTDAELDLFTRALFSAVHGIVLLGLDEASAGVPADQIDDMIAVLLLQLVNS